MNEIGVSRTNLSPRLTEPGKPTAAVAGSARATFDRYLPVLGAVALGRYQRQGGHMRLVDQRGGKVPARLQYVPSMLSNDQPYVYQNELLAIVNPGVDPANPQPGFSKVLAVGLSTPDGNTDEALVAFFRETAPSDACNSLLLMLARDIEAVLLNREITRLLSLPFIHETNTRRTLVEPAWQACFNTGMPLSLATLRLNLNRPTPRIVEDHREFRRLRARTATILNQRLIDDTDTLLGGPVGEFVLLLRGRGGMDAQALCNDLLEVLTLRAAAWQQGSLVSVRFAFGVASTVPTAPFDNLEFAKLTVRLNSAVREAEDSGSNRIVVAAS